MTRAYNRELVHGTVSGYIYRACRCEECLQAVRDYYGHKPLAVQRAETRKSHGSRAEYQRGCRCDECRAHQTAVRRAYRHAHPEEERAYKRAYRAKKQAKLSGGD